MAGLIKVRPTDLLHGEVYLTSQIVISPKEGWKDIPFTPNAPSNEKKRAEYDEVMKKLRFYYDAGKFEVSCFTPKKINKKVDPFYCADPMKLHVGAKYPATYGNLCAYCFAHQEA